MPTFNVVVLEPRNGKVEDTKGRPFRRVEDKETGQIYTLYPKRGVRLKLPAPGDVVTFNGTLHPLGDGIKLIARSITPAK